MSAFMVSDQTITLAVSAMLSPMDACDRGDWLGGLLMKLNAAAVYARYPTKPGEASATEIAELDAKGYRYYPPKADPFAQLVALQCLLYQCSEGDCGKTILYGEVKETINRLLAKIVGELPEYKAATKTGWN